MKKRTFAAMAAVAAFVLLSLSFRKDNANLIAPSGQRIAASMHALKAESMQIVAGRHSGQEFEIIDVSFLPVKKGYAAIVTYKLQDGSTDSYGIFSGVKLKLPQREALSTEARDGKVKITCSGTCTCHLSATIDADTGEITVSCGCSGCKAEMTQV